MMFGGGCNAVWKVWGGCLQSDWSLSGGGEAIWRLLGLSLEGV